MRSVRVDDPCLDSITQAVLGASIAEVGFTKKLGRGAVVFGAICGVVPDLDVATRVLGEWASLVHHRGITHSLLFLPLLSIFVGWVGFKQSKQGTLLVWIHLAFWALFTHPLLDLFTTYGTQLLAPVSDQRFSLDAVGIIDPFYTVPLAVGLVLCKRRGDARARRFMIGTLIFSTAYLLLGAAASVGVQRQAERALLASGFHPQKIRSPTPIFFPTLRRVVAQDAAGNIKVGFARIFGEAPEFIDINRPKDPLIDAALESPEGKIFKWFADGLLGFEIEHDDQGAVLRLHDERYGQFLNPTKSIFGAVARFDKKGVLQSFSRSPRARDLDVGAELKAGFRIVIGSAPRRSRPAP